MARIRTFKAEIFSDSKTGKLPGDAFKLFCGLLTWSDDYGVLQDDPETIQARVFPFNPPSAGVVALLSELVEKGLISRFRASVPGKGEQSCLWVRNFLKHQVVNRPSLPMLGDDWSKGTTPETFKHTVNKFTKPSVSTQGAITEDSVTPPGVLQEPSVSTHVGRKERKERSGTERSGVERSSARGAAGPPASLGAQPSASPGNGNGTESVEDDPEDTLTRENRARTLAGRPPRSGEGAT